MPEIKLPTTLEEAIEYLYPRFDGMDKYFICTEDSFSAYCHSQLSGGIGMKIRNELGFWTKDTDIYHHMKSVQNIDHPDDMGDEIIRGIYRKYHSEHPGVEIEGKVSPLADILKQVTAKPHNS